MFDEYDNDPKPFRWTEDKPERLPWWIAFLAVILIGGILYVAMGYRAAWSHEALPTAAKPQGWSYPFSCCSGYDCREVPADWVTAGRDGYTIVITGEQLSYGDTRLKDSPDGEYHWCSVAGANNSRTICLFRPPMGF